MEKHYYFRSPAGTLAAGTPALIHPQPREPEQSGLVLAPTEI